MNASDAVGRIHSLESFGSADGPGVRFVVFLQGCHMRCRYCHNPDTWSPDAFSREMQPQELLDYCLRFRSYWGKSGGITVSGGEPLLQQDFLISFFELAHKEQIHTAIDTAGQPFCEDPDWLEKFDRLLSVTDLVILDLKEMDSEKHRSLTGHDNENILRMAEYVSEHDTDLWIRHVLVPGLTDDPEGLRRMRDFISTLKTVRRVEILPYHTLGVSKWERSGLFYSLGDTPLPTPEEIRSAKEALGISD